MSKVKDPAKISEHEAAHCVVAAVLGFDIQSVSIVADSESAGRLTYSIPANATRASQLAVICAPYALGTRFLQGDDAKQALAAGVLDASGSMTADGRQAFAKARQILNAHRAETQNLAHALRENLRLQAYEIYSILRLPCPSRPTSTASSATGYTYRAELERTRKQYGESLSAAAEAERVKTRLAENESATERAARATASLGAIAASERRLKEIGRELIAIQESWATGIPAWILLANSGADLEHARAFAEANGANWEVIEGS